MSLPVPSFAALAAGNQNLSLLDSQFNALGACVDIPCTATGSNAVLLTPAANTPSIALYTPLTPKFVWTQATTSTGSVTITIAGLAALNAYRNNGQTGVGSGDLVAGSAYTAFYVPSLNSGVGGFVVDVLQLAAGSGAFVSVVNYTSIGSGAVTIPAGATRAYVQMWGATGGSGSSAGGPSGGTGAGGYLEKYLTGLTAGNTLTYTQGAFGAAGVGSAGGNGGTTTLASGSQAISTLTCNGSNGSAASTTNSLGTAGGTATGGDVNITGQHGGNTAAVNLIFPGGSNFFSTGANGAPGSSPGNAGNSGGLLITWYT